MPKENLSAALSRLRRVDLGVFPTPLQRLCNTEIALSYSGIYIKRDDLTGLGPGGKKIRSLEFILAEALAQGADTIVVAGPGQSNLCTLTAASCAKLGLKCVAVHNAESPSRYEGNLLLNKLMGVESYFIGPVSQQEREDYAVRLAKNLRSAGRAPYVIRNGGTSGLGALGYVNLALELYRQCTEQELPIKTIFAPGGNGGLASGLIYGNALLGKPFNIVIISVEDALPQLTAHIHRTIAEAEAILQLPFSGRLEDFSIILDGYRGEGWGHNTAESVKAVWDMPQREGIFLEHVYNSKVWAGLEDCLGQGKDWGAVCYLHTGGFSSLFGQFSALSEAL